MSGALLGMVITIGSMVLAALGCISIDTYVIVMALVFVGNRISEMDEGMWRRK